MKRTSYKESKQVLVFNGARTLIGVFRSLHSAALYAGGTINLQAISHCCSGRHISTGGFYFRHVHPDIEIEMSDLDNLQLDEYDKMCGQNNRKYHSVREMARRRAIIEKKRNNQI